MSIGNGITLLGKNTNYIQNYSPDLLESLPRAYAREEIKIQSGNLPFSGFDLWTGFELSWLNNKGKPVVAIADFFIPATSRNIIESKSFKLYLNSFNQTRFATTEQVAESLRQDLSLSAVGEVKVNIYPHLTDYPAASNSLPGECIDQLDIEIGDYTFKPEHLIGSTFDKIVFETLSSNLLKSNCLVTNQPDWGSVVIRYEGQQIDREKLLRYIISFRMHNEFHEQCVERIFNDINYYCRPEKLSVFARYTRRGGLDINPFRSNFEERPAAPRLIRQ
ncbi:7-cyano-7-deazaguanine reductase [Erwinia toletana]|uniref:NADPH-dependent 7-cyano-7-deazaguanine reductase n=2 Tax=Winslowiella toletana TaxID=92490 RepID=A0ABS4PBS7_9GAMM|nr:7-cyano-7-deazaguanine reductase [Winslowiella toletana]